MKHVNLPININLDKDLIQDPEDSEQEDFIEDKSIQDRIQTYKNNIKKKEMREIKTNKKNKLKRIIRDFDSNDIKLQDTKLKFISNQYSYYMWGFASLLFVLYLILTYVFNNNNRYFSLIIIILCCLIGINLLYSTIYF